MRISPGLGEKADYRNAGSHGTGMRTDFGMIGACSRFPVSIPRFTSIWFPTIMSPRTAALIRNEATANGLAMSSSFGERLDWYLRRHFANAGDWEKEIIEVYLSNGAIRIAVNEGKKALEGEDLKASIWLFHQPTGLDDTCIEAGMSAIRLEGQRRESARGRYVIGGTANRGLLTEGFARHLDARGDGSSHRPLNG